MSHFVKKLVKGFILITLITLTQLPNNSYARSLDWTSEASYVVIGAFAYHNNAIRFTEHVKAQHPDATFGLNSSRNLFYVYIYASYDVESALRELRTIRSKYGYRDAWVFTGVLTSSSDGTVTHEAPMVRHTQNTHQTPTRTAQSNEPVKQSETLETRDNNNHTRNNNTRTAIATSLDNEPVVTNPLDKEEGHYYLYFNTVNLKNLTEVKGRVKAFDMERLKSLGVHETHEIIKLKDPANGTGRVKFSTDIFGFREIQHVIDLDDPINDTTQAFASVVGDSIILDFELKRFKKGDILVMYNVYFYKDAAIMKPESVYELNSFLDMLQENEKLKVRIHGHTNGNSQGKIIHLNHEAKNYFSLHADHKETVGSAKKLSLYRAETIQHWLMDQGISEDRLEIKGWGGKKMMYDKHDPQAHKNVRVEVEIIQE